MFAARKFFISGLVQGVGYRYFAQRSAARHQVKGYIRNLDDGRVEAFVEGKESEIEAFRQDLAAGPVYAEIDNIEEFVMEPERKYSTFRIER